MAVPGAPGSRLALASSSSSRSTRSSASRSATRTRSTSRSRSGTRSTGTSATSSRCCENISDGGPVPDPLPAHVRVRGHRDRDLALLIGYPVAYYAARHAGKVARAHPRAARASLVDQLPDADDRLDQPALAGGLGARRSSTRASIDQLFISLGLLENEGGWLEGQPATVDLRPRLRLHPVPDPAALRGARPDRPAPHRGGARPRREPLPGLPARHPAALDAGDPRRPRARSPCRCSATTTRTTSSRPRPRRA